MLIDNNKSFLVGILIQKSIRDYVHRMISI